jgi:large subunit ribosomal protein L22
MKVTAKLNYLHMSPRKVRALVNVVKGLKAKEALEQFKFLPQRASVPLEKLLKSAMANAEHNFSLATDDLRISMFKVDGGPIFKRFRPGSRGRVSPLKRKTSHITLVLEGERRKTEKAGLSQDKSENIVEKERTKTEHKKEMSFKVKSEKKKASGGFVRKMFQRKAI